MTHEAHKVVKEAGGRRIVIADSATSVTEDNKNDIVVNGSHCGANIAPDYISQVVPVGRLAMMPALAWKMRG